MSISPNNVKVVEGCSPKNIPDWIFQSGEPLVLKGVVADWPIVQKGRQSERQASDYLRSFYSGKPVTYYYGAPEIQGKIFFNKDYTGFNFQRSEANLNNVLALLEQHSDQHDAPLFYIGSTRVDEWLPGFRAENDLGLSNIDPLVSIWLGNRSVIAAHYDCPDNIACNVVGKRTFTLFPPEQLGNLYVGPLDITPSGRAISMVDLLQPDFEKYPRFKQALAASVVAELDAGDAVFIPGMWWHHVQAHTNLNVLVNYWWRNVPEYMGNPENVLHHALLGLRDLPKHQRDIWKKIFDYYVFDKPETAGQHIPPQIQGILAPTDELIARKIRSHLANLLKR
jgi:hypothetical protein